MIRQNTGVSARKHDDEDSDEEEEEGKMKAFEVEEARRRKILVPYSY